MSHFFEEQPAVTLTYVCICVCMYVSVCMYVCMYMCVCMYIHVQRYFVTDAVPEVFFLEGHNPEHRSGTLFSWDHYK
jgi:hypothetical protein